MAILAKCPVCHRKMKTTKKLCKCGVNMDAAKSAMKVMYYIAQRINGKQLQISCGTSIEKARDIEADRRIKRRQGTLVDAMPGRDWTISDLVKWYLDRDEVQELASFKTGSIQAECHRFARELGIRKVYDLALLDLKGVQSRRKHKGYAPRTIDGEIARIKTALRLAIDCELLSDVVLKPFNKRKLEKLLKRRANRRTKTLEVDEMDRLEDASEGYVKHIFQIARWTAMRYREIRKLEWSRVDLKKRIIRLRGGEPGTPTCDTKNGKPRRVPISHTLVRILEGIRKEQMTGKIRALDSNRVILKNGKAHFNASTFRSDLGKACEQVGILYGRKVEDGFCLHDLRHTFVRVAREAGVHQNVTDAIDGHSINTMNAYYDNVRDTDLLVAIDQIEEYVTRESVGQDVGNEKKDQSIQ